MQPETYVDPLLAIVEEFLLSNGVSPTTFGYKTLNDPTLVHEMRKGRECKHATRTKILEFIAAHKEQAA